MRIEDKLDYQVAYSFDNLLSRLQVALQCFDTFLFEDNIIEFFYNQIRSGPFLVEKDKFLCTDGRSVIWTFKYKHNAADSVLLFLKFITEYRADWKVRAVHGLSQDHSLKKILEFDLKIKFPTAVSKYVKKKREVI